MRLQLLIHRTALVVGITTSTLLGMQPLTQATPMDASITATSASTDAVKLSIYAVERQDASSQLNTTFSTDATFQVEQPIVLAQFTAPTATPLGDQSTLDVASEVQLPTMEVASMEVASAYTKQIEDVTTSTTPSYGFSYIGGGINIGLGSGRTGLGQTSFAIISKIGLASYLSFRPSILFTDNLTVLLPVTYDFRGRKVGGTSVLPFLGAGVAAATRNGTSFELLLTAGVDVPITKEITITGSLNATVTGGSSIGILLGVAYNFE
jgi:hypothetical protein